MIQKVILGDCLDEMTKFENNSVDLILADLPFGTTMNKWDSVISLDKLWLQYERVAKDDCAIVLNAQCPFDKVLGVSNLKILKYEWIWEKEAGTGFLNAKKYPLKSHENILVFCKGLHKYNPQMEVGKPYICKKGGPTDNYNKDTKTDIITVNTGERYPKTVLRFQRDKTRLHSTQKPVLLLEYLIKTYTNENDLVLDSCCGSGSTLVAAKNLNRQFIGIEKEEKYYNIALERLK